MKISILPLLSFTAFLFTPFSHSMHIRTAACFTDDEKAEKERLKPFAEKAINYCRQHNMDESLCFIVDMSMPASRYRFFVYDLKHGLILNKGIVAHGCCNNSFLETPEFSNNPGSGCSSLGKYRIGEKYSGRFGKSYKLYGLDSSNSNALKRNVVLHSYYQVPDVEVYPKPVCNSLGCVMVSDNFLRKISVLIDGSAKPILLWLLN